MLSVNGKLSGKLSVCAGRDSVEADASILKYQDFLVHELRLRHHSKVGSSSSRELTRCQYMNETKNGMSCLLCLEVKDPTASLGRAEVGPGAPSNTFFSLPL